jgi:hypothetical protein
MTVISYRDHKIVMGAVTKFDPKPDRVESEPY